MAYSRMTPGPPASPVAHAERDTWRGSRVKARQGGLGGAGRRAGRVQKGARNRDRRGAADVDGRRLRQVADHRCRPGTGAPPSREASAGATRGVVDEFIAERRAEAATGVGVAASRPGRIGGARRGSGGAGRRCRRRSVALRRGDVHGERRGGRGPPPSGRLDRIRGGARLRDPGYRGPAVRPGGRAAEPAGSTTATRHLGLGLGDRACLAAGRVEGCPVLTSDPGAGKSSMSRTSTSGASGRSTRAGRHPRVVSRPHPPVIPATRVPAG